MEFSHCPRDPDEATRGYLLGHLTREAAISFEEHYLGCPRCAERLQFTEEFILAFRRATERLRSTPARIKPTRFESSNRPKLADSRRVLSGLH